MILTLLFWWFFSKIVDWMGFSRPSIEMGFAFWHLDQVSVRIFRCCREVSVENTFDPSHAPFLHNGISKYSPDKAGGPMRQRRFDEVKIGTRLGSVDGSCWWFRNLAKQLRLVVYPTFDRVSLIHPRWLLFGFLPQYDWRNTPPKKKPTSTSFGRGQIHATCSNDDAKKWCL